MFKYQFFLSSLRYLSIFPSYSPSLLCTRYFASKTKSFGNDNRYRTVPYQKSDSTQSLHNVFGNTTINNILSQKKKKQALCSSNICSVNKDTTVQDATLKMIEQHIGCLVVLSSVSYFEGLIDERQCLQALSTDQKLNTVKDIMTPKDDILICSLNTEIQEVMLQMTNRKTRYAVCIEGDKLFGIVSLGDLVFSILNSEIQTCDQLTSFIYNPY